LTVSRILTFSGYFYIFSNCAHKIAQQLNQQLTQLQQQIDVYKQQVSQYENVNTNNQQQLTNRLKQQEMTIQILVEEKAELNGKVRNLEEIEINTKGHLDNSSFGFKKLK